MMGFKAANYTQVPNDLFVMMADMSEAELKVVMCAVRKIVGYHKDKAEAISYTQFEQMTGLKRPSVVKGVKAAIKRGIMRIAGKGAKGVNLYELVIEEEAIAPAEEVDQELIILTSEDVTSKKSLPVTSKKSLHTKESSKENKDIAAGNVIPMTDKPKPPSVYDGMYEAVESVFGHKAGINKDYQKFLVGTATKTQYKPYNLPMEKPVTPDELIAWARWYRSLELGGKSELSMVQSPAKIQSSILKYRELKDKQHQQAIKKPIMTRQELAEKYNLRIIQGLPVDDLIEIQEQLDREAS